MPPTALVLVAALAIATSVATSQEAPPRNDSLASVTFTVRHDDAPAAGVVVRSVRDSPGTNEPASPQTAAQTDALGMARLRLPAGPHTLVAGRLGLRPDTLRLTLRAGRDTAITIALEEQETELETIVVTATRGERRVEDTPLRVEVIGEEEIAEKVAMTPGDIAMMLNETSGLRVQSSSPSLGGASVRIQGLRGRYSLVLSDGLPLYGQAGGLGLMQIPPLDLARVEVIKGSASALYGGSALGGVINLISRRPSRETARTVLVNRTSRGGSDGVLFGSGPITSRVGYTLLAGAHGQTRQDVDDDGWMDIPGYSRGVVRPRLYFNDGEGRTAFVTAGFTAEDRNGGSPEGRGIPGGIGPFVEGLRTRRADVGALARWAIADSSDTPLHGAILTVRGVLVGQRHGHRFGGLLEHDRHRTDFVEAALAVPRGRFTTVAGAAYERDSYRAADVAGVDYTHSVPAAFAQVDVDVASRLSLSASVRAESHNVYGTAVNPRLSLLLRGPSEGALAGWTSRLSGGTGTAAPTPFTDEVDATTLSSVEPYIVDGRSTLVAERARSASLDVGGPVRTAFGRLELNATAFASRIEHPLLARDSPRQPVAGSSRLLLANASVPTTNWGADMFARLRIENVLSGELGLLGTYVHLRSTDEDPGEPGVRRDAPLTPRHAAGVDVIWEKESHGRLGLEFFYTGRQSLDDNPYRTESRPYLLVGLLGEWRVGRSRRTRIFVNGENLGGVRQTRFDPLVLPQRGRGGRWTTDAWTELTGATINAGVRADLP
ncbi:MAG TPA: TonB-dependent receptor [Gemmatimonadaceae bacterium]|nr:TonB-dependent receptor [Gemmatimonadaceae bacterium]